MSLDALKEAFTSCYEWAGAGKSGGPASGRREWYYTKLTGKPISEMPPRQY